MYDSPFVGLPMLHVGCIRSFSRCYRLLGGRGGPGEAPAMGLCFLSCLCCERARFGVCPLDEGTTLLTYSVLYWLISTHTTVAFNAEYLGSVSWLCVCVARSVSPSSPRLVNCCSSSHAWAALKPHSPPTGHVRCYV